MVVAANTMAAARARFARESSIRSCEVHVRPGSKVGAKIQFRLFRACMQLAHARAHGVHGSTKTVQVTPESGQAI